LHFAARIDPAEIALAEAEQAQEHGQGDASAHPELLFGARLAPETVKSG
jgi:hypothetical protein